MDESQRREIERLYKKQMGKFYKKAMNDESIPQGAREGLQALWASHSRKGQEYRMQGRLREAIEEFRKDTELGITGHAEATLAETAYALIGDTYMELGEIENAIAAYEGALELWREYGYGFAPHVSLAEAYLKQGRVDDAISVCEEQLDTPGSWAVRQVWEKAMRRKLGGEQ